MLPRTRGRRRVTARPLDVAPAGPVEFPDAGLGRGWEAGALLILTAFLLAFGLVTLYSASAVLAMRQDLPDTFYVAKQAVAAALGTAALVVCAWLPYERWRVWAWPMVWVVAGMLVILVLPGTEAIAPRVNGARRWLRVGVSFQPSELAKIAMVVWTAALAVKKAPHFHSLGRGLLPFFVGWTVLLVPIAFQPDLSTTVIVAAVGLAVLFAAGARIAHFLFLVLLATPLLLDQLQAGFRRERLEVFLNPALDPAGTGYQIRQSLVALGSGGIAGVGFGEGRQKFGFLPEAHNDFIFAMIGEEWGLLGVTVMVTLYMAVALVGFRIAARARDPFGELLAVGLTSLIAGQALLHMGVALGLVPATGLPLPLVSYGRSNLVVTMVAVGMLVSVARGTPGGRTSRA